MNNASVLEICTSLQAISLETLDSESPYKFNLYKKLVNTFSLYSTKKIRVLVVYQASTFLIFICKTLMLWGGGMKGSEGDGDF